MQFIVKKGFGHLDNSRRTFSETIQMSVINVYETAQNSNVDSLQKQILLIRSGLF